VIVHLEKKTVKGEIVLVVAGFQAPKKIKKYQTNAQKNEAEHE